MHYGVDWTGTHHTLCKFGECVLFSVLCLKELGKAKSHLCNYENINVGMKKGKEKVNQETGKEKNEEIDKYKINNWIANV